MERMRQFAKKLICLSFLMEIGIYLTEGIIALIVLIAVLANGQSEQWPELTIKVIGTIVLMTFIWWVSKDARKTSKRLRQERHQRKAKVSTELDPQDLSPEHPPWMG